MDESNAPKEIKKNSKHVSIKIKTKKKKYKNNKVRKKESKNIKKKRNAYKT